MKYSFLPRFTAGFVLALAAPGFGAGVAVDLNGGAGNFGIGGIAGPTYADFGADGDGPVWNGRLATAGFFDPDGLVDFTGAATNIGYFSQDNLDGFSYAGAPANDLMNDYAFAIPDDTGIRRFTVFSDSGTGANPGGMTIAPGSVWDVYIYASGDTSGQFASFSVQGSSYVSTTGATVPFGGTFTQGDNYLLFEDVVATPTGVDGGEIEILFQGNAGFAPFNGFAIVAVPEPSAALLGGLGILGLLRRRR